MGNTKINEKYHEWSFTETTISNCILFILLLRQYFALETHKLETYVSSLFETVLSFPKLGRNPLFISPWPDYVIKKTWRKSGINVRRLDFQKRPLNKTRVAQWADWKKTKDRDDKHKWTQYVTRLEIVLALTVDCVWLTWDSVLFTVTLKGIILCRYCKSDREVCTQYLFSPALLWFVYEPQ